MVMENRGERKTVQLNFTGLGKLPDSLSAILLRPHNAKALPLRKTTAVLEQTETKETLQILIGTQEYIRIRIKEFKNRFGQLLEQNVPNPFRTVTSILYRVPWHENGSAQKLHVLLEVYNLRGKRVAELVNEVQMSGKNTVLWEGMNNKGMSLPSGTYFYRLHVGKNLEAQKKLVYFK